MAVSQAYTILWGTGVVFVILPHFNLGLLSDYKICGDPECESLMSRVQAIRDHHGEDCRFLSFRRGDTIFVYHKLTGKREDLWAGSIDKQFGYFPKDAVQEEQVYATMEKAVETQKSDFFCMDDFGYPIDSSHLDSDDEDDDDDQEIQNQGSETTQTTPYTDNSNAEMPSTYEDPSTESTVSAQEADTTSAEEDGNKNAGDALKEARETPVALNEQGGSSSPSWLSSSVTGWLGLTKEEEAVNMAKEENKYEEKMMQAEASVASSLTGWLGLGGGGQPDDAVISRDNDRETADSFTSTMTGWLGFGGEKKTDHSTEKEQDEEREYEESAEKFRSRRMSLDLEGSQLHEEEKKEMGTLDWLGNGLSGTLGFGLTNQESGHETTPEREAEETIQGEEGLPPSGSWLDMGIRDILGFKKDKSEVDESTGSSFKETEEDKNLELTGSENVDISQSQPPLTEDVRTETVDETPKDSLNNATPDSSKDSVLPEAAEASKVDLKNTSPQTELQETSQAVGGMSSVLNSSKEDNVSDDHKREKSLLHEERSAEVEGQHHQVRREPGEDETASYTDLDFSARSDINLGPDFSSEGEVEEDKAEEVDQEGAEVLSQINNTEESTNTIKGEGNNAETDVPIKNDDDTSPAHSVETNSDSPTVIENDTETETQQGELGHQGEGSSQESGAAHSTNRGTDITYEKASEEDRRRFSTSESTTQMGNSADEDSGFQQGATQSDGDAHKLKETETDSNKINLQPVQTETEKYIVNESGLKSAIGSETETKEVEESRNEEKQGEIEELMEEEKQEEVEDIKEDGEQELKEQIEEIKEEKEQQGELKEDEKQEEVEDIKEDGEQELKEDIEEIKEEEKQEEVEDIKENGEQELKEEIEEIEEEKEQQEELKEDEKQEEVNELKEEEIKDEMEEIKEEKEQQEGLKKKEKQEEVNEIKEEEIKDEVEEIKEKEQEEELKEEEKHEEVSELKEEEIKNELEEKEQQEELKEEEIKDEMEEIKEEKEQQEELKEEEIKDEMEEIKEEKEQQEELKKKEKQKEVNEIKEEEIKDEVEEIKEQEEELKDEEKHEEVSELKEEEIKDEMEEIKEKEQQKELNEEEKQEEVKELNEEGIQEEVKELKEEIDELKEENSLLSSESNEKETLDESNSESVFSKPSTQTQKRQTENPQMEEEKREEEDKKQEEVEEAKDEMKQEGVEEKQQMKNVEAERRNKEVDGSLNKCSNELCRQAGEDELVRDKEGHDSVDRLISIYEETGKQKAVDDDQVLADRTGGGQRAPAEDMERDMGDIQEEKKDEGGTEGGMEVSVTSRAEISEQIVLSDGDNKGTAQTGSGGAFNLFKNTFSFFRSPITQTEASPESAPSLDSNTGETFKASLPPEQEPDPTTDSSQVYVQDVLTDSPVTVSQISSPSPTQTHSDTNHLTKHYQNLLAHMGADETTVLTELFGRHKLQFLDYILGSSDATTHDPNNDESILLDTERLMHYHRETLVAPSMRLGDAPQEDKEKTRVLIALQKLEMLLARVRETFNTAEASCVGESCSTHSEDQGTDTEEDSSVGNYSPRDEWMELDKETNWVTEDERKGGKGKRSEEEKERASSESRPHIEPGSPQPLEGVVKQILDFVHKMAEESTPHVHAVREILIWLTVRVLREIHNGDS